MSILLPIVLTGLAGVALLEPKTSSALPPHPASAYAEAMTAHYAALGPKVKLTYLYDETAQTLIVTGQLSSVIPLRKIKLVAESLTTAFERAVHDSLDREGLAEMGVGVAFRLVDRNRTPIEV